MHLHCILHIVCFRTTRAEFLDAEYDWSYREL